MYGGATCPGGPEKGLLFDKRRPGGGPAHETGLEDVDAGDCIVEPNCAGLPAIVEYVADVGVVGAFDCES